MHKIEIRQTAIDRALTRRGRLRIYDAIEPAASALIVVDLQNTFCAPGFPCEVPMAREIVPNVNRLAEAFRAAGGHVVWIQNTIRDRTRIDWSVWVDRIMTPELSDWMCREMAPGSEGHKLWPGLDVHPQDATIEKCRFSAFIQGASTLDAYLKDRGIDTVAITGTATHVCCESTARDAMMLNYKTIFVSDATAAATDEDHNGTLSALIQSFCDIQSTDELIGTLKAGQGMLAAE